MRREFAALAGLGGLAALGGAAWFFTRDRSGGVAASGVSARTPAATSPGVSVASGGARRVGKVFHRERLDPLDARLGRAADEYAQVGPWSIVIVDGLRAGPEAAARQLGYFTTGASGAKTLDKTPHGRAAAFDFAVVKQANGDAVVSTYTAAEHPDLYRQVGEWFEARGLVWGGRFTNIKGGDGPHIEVPNWAALPYPPKGVA